MEIIEKWFVSCEEESWLEDYNKVNMTRTRDHEIWSPTFSSHCKKHVDIDVYGRMKTDTMQAEVHALP